MKAPNKSKPECSVRFKTRLSLSVISICRQLWSHTVKSCIHEIVQMKRKNICGHGTKDTQNWPVQDEPKPLLLCKNAAVEAVLSGCCSCLHGRVRHNRAEPPAQDIGGWSGDYTPSHLSPSFMSGATGRQTAALRFPGKHRLPSAPAEVEQRSPPLPSPNQCHVSVLMDDGGKNPPGRFPLNFVWADNERLVETSATLTFVSADFNFLSKAICFIGPWRTFARRVEATERARQRLLKRWFQ